MWDYWTIWFAWICGIIDNDILCSVFVPFFLFFWRRNVLLLCALFADLMLYIIIYRCDYNGCMHNTWRLFLAKTRHINHKRSPPIRRMLAQKLWKHLCGINNVNCHVQISIYIIRSKSLKMQIFEQIRCFTFVVRISAVGPVSYNIRYPPCAKIRTRQVYNGPWVVKFISATRR